MKRVCPVSCMDMKSPDRNKCEDIHENCPVWLGEAECETNVSVKKYCQLSCGRCQEKGNAIQDSFSASNTSQETESCNDGHKKCSDWAVSVLMFRCRVFQIVQIDAIATQIDDISFYSEPTSNEDNIILSPNFIVFRAWENAKIIQTIC